MAKDLTVSIENRPGTLADIGEALGRAGINIDGICGFPAGGEGELHLLVEDAAGAREALTSAGAQVRGERDVVLAEVQDRPGEGGKLLRRIADQGVNVDLVYLTMSGQLVLGGQDVEGIRRAVG